MNVKVSSSRPSGTMSTVQTLMSFLERFSATSAVTRLRGPRAPALVETDQAWQPRQQLDGDPVSCQRGQPAAVGVTPAGVRRPACSSRGKISAMNCRSSCW